MSCQFSGFLSSLETFSGVADRLDSCEESVLIVFMPDVDRVSDLKHPYRCSMPPLFEFELVSAPLLLPLPSVSGV